MYPVTHELWNLSFILYKNLRDMHIVFENLFGSYVIWKSEFHKLT
jgi:hypothetical protein